jgi:hypothetical protein
MATDIHEGSAGAVGRLLGLLATMLGRADDARLHFGVGIALNEATEAHGWAAHTRCDLAELLLRADDQEGAQPLLAAAAESAHRLGMVVLAGRVEALRTGG